MISGMIVPPLSQKVAFLLIWVKVCPQKLAFSQFLANFMSWLFDKVLPLSNKKSTFVLVSGFLAVVLFEKSF